MFWIFHSANFPLLENNSHSKITLSKSIYCKKQNSIGIFGEKRIFILCSLKRTLFAPMLSIRKLLDLTLTNRLSVQKHSKCSFDFIEQKPSGKPKTTTFSICGFWIIKSEFYNFVAELKILIEKKKLSFRLSYDMTIWVVVTIDNLRFMNLNNIQHFLSITPYLKSIQMRTFIRDIRNSILKLK